MMRPFIPARKYEVYMDPQRDVLGSVPSRSFSFAPPSYQLAQQQLAQQELHRAYRTHSPVSSSKRAYSTPPPQSSFHSAMVGPIRTADSRDESKGPSGSQPPRPPNAWILYRSDKLRELPPPTPGAPRRAQADISKQISQMWKSESDTVRAEYEFRANQKKTEHQEKYPNYRFQPMKRAEKERLREEKKQRIDRERAESKRGKGTRIPFVPGIIPPVLAHPSTVEARYGPTGPSPPLSAAPSRDGSPIPFLDAGTLGDALQNVASSSSQHASAGPISEEVASPEAGPSTGRSGRSSGSPSQPSQPDSKLPSPLSLISPRPIFAIEQSLSQSLSQLSDWNASSRGTSTAEDAAAMLWWRDMAASQSNTSDTSNDFLHLNIPLPDPSQGWETDDPTFSSAMQAFLQGTQDPNIFQISALDPTGQENSSVLLQDPAPGEIEVSMTNAFAQYTNLELKGGYGDTQTQPNSFDNFSPDFYMGLDFPTVNLLSDHKLPPISSSSFTNPSTDSTSPAVSTPDSVIDNATLLSLSVDHLLALQRQAGSASSIDGLNLDSMVPVTAAVPGSTPPRPSAGIAASIASSYAQSQFQNSSTQKHDVRTRPSPTSQRPAPPTHSYSMPAPYVPPAGAIHASKRRAAANWTKKSFPVTLSGNVGESDEDEDVKPVDLEWRDRQRQRAGA